MVAHFAEHNPRATRAQWGGFAISLVEESYRSGFARGFERAERDPEPPWRAPLPSEPDLPWSPESVVDCLDEVVPDRVDPDERLQARLMEETKR